MNKDIAYFHANLKDEINLTQEYIRVFSLSKDKTVNREMEHIINNPGKMLRPILMHLSGRYAFEVGNEERSNEKQLVDDLAKAGAILELIQISSLVHDDVLDHSSVRRDKATLNSMRGNRFAILMGDYLVAQSLKNCYNMVQQAERMFDSDIMRCFLENISKLILGEIQQNNFNEGSENEEGELKSYFEIVENKTASLFSLACSVGAKIGKADEATAYAFEQFGHHIGMAYQIIDDLRDFAFSEEIAGEKNFQDMKYGVKTLPLIYAATRLQNGEMEKLMRGFDTKKDLPEDLKLEVIEILEKTGSISSCLVEAKSHMAKARIILYRMPENTYSVLLSEFVNYLSDIGEAVGKDFARPRVYN